MNNETQPMDRRIRRQSRRHGSLPTHAPLPGPGALAGPPRAESPRHGNARPAPVARAIWAAADGTRLRLTHVTRQSVEFQNLATGGNGLMARAWLEKHFTPENA